MSHNPRERQVDLRCPSCGSQATALLVWHDAPEAPHPTVKEYRCPRGCRVDEETVRSVIGVA